MNTPPLLLGLGVLFWGWQTGLLTLAVPIALLLEGSRVVKARWDFSDADFSRLWALCVALFAGAAIYAFTQDDGGALLSFSKSSSAFVRNNVMKQGTHAMLLFIEWLPFVFLPIVAAQAYSRREKIDVTVFSGLARRWRRLRGAAWRPPSVSVAMPYVSICLAAAAAANSRGPEFFAGLSVLLCWALWPQRSRRFAPAVWIALAAVVIGTGFAGARGLLKLHYFVENLHTDWVAGMLTGRGREASESVTAIGRDGRLNLSGGIVMRVELGSPSDAPPLLRMSSFDIFRSPVWSASKRGFHGIAPEPDTTTWKFRRDSPAARELTVHVSVAKPSDLLSLPLGTGELRELPVSEVRTNRFGDVNVLDTPGFLSYVARYGPGRTLDGPTNEMDFAIPYPERAAVERIARELKLASLSAPEKLRAVARFFSANFSYTQNLQRDRKAPKSETALTSFLLRQRAGHCEYFATATVLLLRHAGVPARYATGYAVDEPDRRRGKGFVVRGRHAHAWCLAYVDGNWVDFDTTPGVWRAGESERSSLWEPVSDWFSRLWFEFSRWRVGQSNIRQYLNWIIAGAMMVIAVRLVQKRQ